MYDHNDPEDVTEATGPAHEPQVLDLTPVTSGYIAMNGHHYQIQTDGDLHWVDCWTCGDLRGVHGEFADADQAWKMGFSHTTPQDQLFTTI